MAKCRGTVSGTAADETAKQCDAWNLIGLGRKSLDLSEAISKRAIHELLSYQESTLRE